MHNYQTIKYCFRILFVGIGRVIEIVPGIYGNFKLLVKFQVKKLNELFLSMSNKFLDILKEDLDPGDVVPVYPDPSFGDRYWLARIVDIGKTSFHGVYLESGKERHFITGSKCQLSFKTIFQRNKKRFYKVALEELPSVSVIGEEADRFLKSFVS